MNALEGIEGFLAGRGGADDPHVALALDDQRPLVAQYRIPAVPARLGSPRLFRLIHAPWRA